MNTFAFVVSLLVIATLQPYRVWLWATRQRNKLQAFDDACEAANISYTFQYSRWRTS